MLYCKGVIYVILLGCTTIRNVARVLNQEMWLYYMESKQRHGFMAYERII